MIRRSSFLLSLAAVFATSSVAPVAAEPLTIEQAEALSKETGRPMLVMAGSKT